MRGGSKSNYVTKGNKPVDVDSVIEFLEQVWLYASSTSADCYTVVVINENVEYKHFCLSEYGDYGRLFKAVKRYTTRCYH